MVRSYKRKTGRGLYGSEVLQQALEAITNGMSLKKASNVYSIPRPTLRRHRDAKVRCPGTVKLGSFIPVLSDEFEKELVSQIQMMEKALFGLTTTDIRRLAYELACKMKLPNTFNKHSQMAGSDWLQGFMSRHQELSLRVPQATSLSRAVGFNRAKVEQFNSVYKPLLDGQTFTAQTIWNMDESGITTVQKPLRIIATKGQRQISKMTSGERGTTVTIICAMSAAGNYIPPMLIFPRKRMAAGLMHGAPAGSIAAVSSSGWTDGELFIQWLKHFAHTTNCSKTAPQLLILDGHHSHKTLAAVEFCRANGITLVTLPPHCTHKLQPLDRTFFKTLKTNYNRACDNWMTSNAGMRITVFEVAGLFCKAYDKTAGVEAAKKGFETTGIWPFDDQKFTDEDFLAAAVTDEPLPADVAQVGTEQVNPAMSMSGEDSTLANTSEVQAEETDPGVAADSDNDIDSSNVTSTANQCVPHPGLEEARKILAELSPRPKLKIARPRTRKAESAAVLTSSPYKTMLEQKAKPGAKRKKSTGVKSTTAATPKPAKQKKTSKKLDQKDETPCCICRIKFGGPPFEDWLQCSLCGDWYHESCGPDDEAVCYQCIA